MFKRLFLLLACCAILLPGHVAAGSVTTYDGCVDASGRPVEAILDDALAATFETRIENGRAVIRYNPAILPQLQPVTRLFLFGHECARLELGMAAEGSRGTDEARQADCRGLSTLMRSQLVGVADFAVIQSDLQLSAQAWQAVPGPMRGVDLHACYRELARQPSLSAPAAGQQDWNACARQCGDALLACRNATCMPVYDRCIAACDARFAR